MIRRYHDAESEEEGRFYAGVLLALALAIPAWVVLLYGALALARRVGVIQ